MLTFLSILSFLFIAFVINNAMLRKYKLSPAFHDLRLHLFILLLHLLLRLLPLLLIVIIIFLFFLFFTLGTRFPRDLYIIKTLLWNGYSSPTNGIKLPLKQTQLKR